MLAGTASLASMGGSQRRAAALLAHVLLFAAGAVLAEHGLACAKRAMREAVSVERLLVLLSSGTE